MTQGRTAEEREGFDYLAEARSILEGLASAKASEAADKSDKASIRKADVLKLLRAKHRAYRESNMGFEGILIDAVRMFDEKARDQNDSSIFNRFSIIATYFDRYDYMQKAVGNIVFRDDASLTEDTLISFFGNKKVFDRIKEGLFYELFINHHLENGHLPESGRKKLKVIAFGLEKISRNRASFKDIVGEFEALGA
ncbi:MAG: hypothetical protein Kow0025_19170 [Thermodesulfovibrionales bacterium]